MSLVGLLFIISLIYSIYVQYIFRPPPLPLPLRANPSLTFASAPIHLLTSSTNPPAAPKEEERRGRRKAVRNEMIFLSEHSNFQNKSSSWIQITRSDFGTEQACFHVCLSMALRYCCKYIQRNVRQRRTKHRIQLGLRIAKKRRWDLFPVAAFPI